MLLNNVWGAIYELQESGEYFVFVGCYIDNFCFGDLYSSEIE